MLFVKLIIPRKCLDNRNIKTNYTSTYFELLKAMRYKLH